MYHINSFVDDNILDRAHLNELGGLAAWGVAGGHLNAQGADDEQRLVVHLHEVDVKHHAEQGDQYGAGQDGSVLQGMEDIYVCENHVYMKHYITLTNYPFTDPQA